MDGRCQAPAASAVLLGGVLWFGAELVTGGGQAGLAERVMGGMQALWPLLVALSCCRDRSRAPAPAVGPGTTNMQNEAVRRIDLDLQPCRHR